MNSQYNTKQKRAVLSYLERHTDRQFTSGEIAEALKNEGIGKSTVYRQLKNLCDEGQVRRFRGEGKSVVFQYFNSHDCRHHLHLKCNSCGRLQHLDCPQIEGLMGHISEEHGFKIDTLGTVIYGSCESCFIKEQGK